MLPHYKNHKRIHRIKSKKNPYRTCAFTSFVPTRTTEQKAGEAVCDAESAADFGAVSPSGTNCDVHAISGKLSTNGTVRRLEDRSEEPPLLAMMNSSHNWSTSANQTSVADER